jgi:hypothetical protein
VYITAKNQKFHYRDQHQRIQNKKKKEKLFNQSYQQIFMVVSLTNLEELLLTPK